MDIHAFMDMHACMYVCMYIQKNICFIDYAKAFDCVDHINCGKFFKRWECQTI